MIEYRLLKMQLEREIKLTPSAKLERDLKIVNYTLNFG